MSTALHALVWFGNLIPQAEGPLPESIDPTLPVTAAGAGSMIGRIVSPGATIARRDQLVRRWSFWFFLIGIVIYVSVYAYQLSSNR